MMTDLKDDDLMNKVIVIFFMFAFLGWVWESIYCTAKDRKWANRCARGEPDGGDAGS